MDENKPWERRVGEPTLWWGRFQAYLLAGPSRSILEQVNKLREQRGQKRSGCLPGSWRRAYAKYEWRERAKAWDEKNLREEFIAAEEARRQMLDRHRRLGALMQGVGGQVVQRYASLLREYTDAIAHGRDVPFPEGLDATTARLFIKEGITIERLASGMPDSLVQFATMTDEELREQYADLLRSIADASRAGDGDEATGDGSS